MRVRGRTSILGLLFIALIALALLVTVLSVRSPAPSDSSVRSGGPKPSDQLDLAGIRNLYVTSNSGTYAAAESLSVNARVRGDIAHSTFGADGTGVTVGIISDSYNCLGGEGTDIASGALPAGVVVLQDMSPCEGGADEGRAMAQIVYGIAPGARILFQTGSQGPASMATGIHDLQAAGADIIVDDISYLTQPFFQDGVVAQAVDARAAEGVTYFSAAGNIASQSYESAYRVGSVFSPGRYPSDADEQHQEQPDPVER
ncbi:MAG: hypothetical protein HOF43_11020 [Chloroflexi bacterium]|nr:hypothetical protein [Chloroflexota bacterium]